MFTDQASGLEAGAEQLVDIHGKFVTWFASGFILSMLPLPIAVLTLAIHVIHAKSGKYFLGFSSVSLACGYTAWWIVGLIWRFSDHGRFASGEQQYRFSSKSDSHVKKHVPIEWDAYGGETVDEATNELF